MLSELAQVRVSVEWERPTWRMSWQDGPTREALMGRAAALGRLTLPQVDHSPAGTLAAPRNAAPFCGRSVVTDDGERIRPIRSRRGPQCCKSRSYLAGFNGIVWQGQVPMTRVSLAASTTSAVMAESSLMLMIRATWPIRRSMSAI